METFARMGKELCFQKNEFEECLNAWSTGLWFNDGSQQDSMSFPRLPTLMVMVII